MKKSKQLQTDTKQAKKKLSPRKETSSTLASVEPEILDAPKSGPETEIEESEGAIVEIDPNLEVLPPELDEPLTVAVDVDEEASDIEALEGEGPKRSIKSREHSDESEGLVRYDPLQAYLHEVRTHPPLTREEETALAIQYRTNNDLEAAYKLVTSNLWLVVKLARDYEKAARGILDLIQEGNIGLMEAVKNFDPYRGVRFPSYASWWIKAYIVRFIIANWRLVKIGTTQAQRKLFFNLKKERDKLEKEGFYPAPKLLAEKLDVKESEVVEMEQRLSGADMSVDAPLTHGEPDSNLYSVLPSSVENAEQLLDRKQEQRLLAESLDEFSETLNPKELTIFRERMLDEEKATLQDMAEKLSLSRERVRQIENRVREKLKVFLEKKLGSEIENFR